MRAGRRDSAGPAAVLVSGGVESAYLLRRLSLTASRLHPVYVRCGLRWESAELHWLRRLLGAVRSRAIRPLSILDLPVSDLYRDHWSLSGRKVPGARTRDDAVYLPGRNLLLISKAASYAALQGLSELQIGTLGSNPFGDATAGFYRSMSRSVSEAFGRSFRIRRPLTRLDKTAVLRRGERIGVPYDLTFSCIDPNGYLHCGRCNKCAERIKAYDRAGVADPTVYAWKARR